MKEKNRDYEQKPKHEIFYKQSLFFFVTSHVETVKN